MRQLLQIARELLCALGRLVGLPLQPFLRGVDGADIGGYLVDRRRGFVHVGYYEVAGFGHAGRLAFDRRDDVV